MPPRKSNVSQISTTNEDGGTPTKEREQGINIEDLSLPRTMVQRLAKGVLPPNTQLHKDVVLAIQKSATVFVNFIAAAANENGQTNNRRTIPPSAVSEALREREFEMFEPKVEAELGRFNEVQTGKRNEYRRKIKEGKKDEDGEGAEENEEARAAKRARMEEAAAAEGVNGLESEGKVTNGGLEGDEHGDGGDGVGGEEEDGDDGMENDEEEEPEEEIEEEEDEEEEEEEDDEDEYPDEGRRLSSLEPDTYGTDARMTTGPNSDEDMSDDGSE